MNEDAVIQKLIEHDHRFDEMSVNMATKEDIRDIKDTLEGIVTIVQRLDQERIFTTEWVRRIETEVDRHRVEIDKVKQRLQIF